MTVGQRTPLAVTQTGDCLQGVPAGEGEAGVALEPGLAPVGDVGGHHGEPVVNLRDGATVNLLAGGDVGVGPLTAWQAGGRDLGHPGGEHLPGGTVEVHHRAEGRVQPGADGALAGLQGGTISRVDGGEPGIGLAGVRAELDVHLPALGRDDLLGRDLVSEPVTRVKLQSVLTIKHLKRGKFKSIEILGVVVVSRKFVASG